MRLLTYSVVSYYYDFGWIFFSKQVFLTFLLSQKLWFKQSDSSWKEAVKKVQVHVFDAKNVVEIKWWIDKRKLKKEGAEN